MRGGMKFEDRDMSPKARAVYEECLRRMTSEQKLREISKLNTQARALVYAGVRLQYPDWDHEQVKAEVRRRMAPWNK